MKRVTEEGPLEELMRLRALIAVGLLLLVVSQAESAGFGPSVRVNELEVLDTAQQAPAMAADGSGNVHAAWFDHRSGVWQIAYSKSADGGKTFGANRFIAEAAATEDPVGSLSIAAAAPDRVHIVWTRRVGGSWDLYLSSSQDGGASFAAPVRVDDAPRGDQLEPSLALDDEGNLFVAWHDDRGGVPAIYTASSLNGGQSFGPGVRVDPASAAQVHPSIVAHGQDRVSVVWQDARSERAEVRFAASADGGVDYGASRPVSEPFDAEQTSPSVAVDAAGNLHVVWQERRFGAEAQEPRIRFSKSQDGGESFTPSVEVAAASSSREQFRPSLRLNSTGHVFVVWIELGSDLVSYAVRASRSRTGGTSFETPSTLGPVAGDAPAASVTLVHANLVVVGWESEFDVLAARSTDGAASFGPPLRVNDDRPSIALLNTQLHPAVALDAAGKTHVVWAELSREAGGAGVWNVYAASSLDAGRTFGPQVRVNDVQASETDIFFPNPSVAVDGAGGLYVVWEDIRSGSRDIYLARSTDGGATFRKNVRVNDAPSVVDFDNTAPVVGVDANGAVYVAWTDGRNGFTTGWDVVLAKSTDGAASFGPNVRVDDSGETYSQQVLPSLAVTGPGVLYLAWQDDREGEEDIYFARSLDGGATFQTNVRVNEAEGPDDLIRQGDPSVAVDAGGGLYVAWTDNREGLFASHVYVARSTNQGASFRPSVRVDDARGDTAEERLPSLAARASGVVAVAWQSGRELETKDFDVYLARSTDGAQHFTADLRVDDGGEANTLQAEPALALDGASHAYVAWTDDRNLENEDIRLATDAPPAPAPPSPTPTASATATRTATPTPSPTPLSPGDLAFLGPFTVSSGRDVEVPVVFHTGTVPLGAYLLEITFDPALLSLTAVKGGVAEFSAEPVHDAGPGRVRLSGLNAQSLISPTGEVRVAGLVLHGLGVGSSQLAVASAELLDTGGAPFSNVHPLTGQVTVVPLVAAFGALAAIVLTLGLLALGRRVPRAGLAALLVAATLSGTLAARSRATGDVDADGTVTAADALRVQESLVGLRQLGPDEKAAADIDGDGQVRLEDALGIAQRAAGLLPPFPTATPAPASPTASRTPTVPPAATATRTSLASPIPSATPTSTTAPILSPTATETPIASATPTTSETPTSSETPTATRTATATSTATP